ncbi:hypothetical protein PoB_003799100 [Plakobranchus ocellatus]|uniref:Uncharacterized protein n=1 Tax=Plakobranchus ocellatus TaxID=259542 RepID=A0AAV4AJY2_9GAST|nr:hypothetical protein PoB_003799100 [Plakobranchus ocellatus]
MFPWDDRGDGHPSDTTLLNTLAPVLVAHRLLTHASQQQGDIRLSGLPSGQGAGGRARTRARRVSTNLKVDSQATMSPAPSPIATADFCQLEYKK